MSTDIRPYGGGMPGPTGLQDVGATPTPSLQPPATSPDDLPPVLDAADSHMEARPQLEPPADGGTLDIADLVRLLQEIRNKLSEVQTAAAREDVHLRAEQSETANKESLAKIQEAIDEMEKARESNDLGRIFGWIGVGLLVVAAVVATVATGGAAAPLVVAAAVALTMMILQETGTMDDIVEKMAPGMADMISFFAQLDPNVSEEEAEEIGEKWGKFAAQMAILAAVIAVQVAATAMSGGGGAGALTGTLAKVAALAQKGAQIGAAAAGMASAGTSAASAVYTYEASMAQADSEESRALMARLQQQMEALIEEIQAVIQAMDEMGTKVTDLMKTESDSHDSINRMMARVPT